MKPVISIRPGQGSHTVAALLAEAGPWAAAASLREATLDLAEPRLRLTVAASTPAPDGAEAAVCERLSAALGVPVALSVLLPVKDMLQNASGSADDESAFLAWCAADEETRVQEVRESLGQAADGRAPAAEGGWRLVRGRMFRGEPAPLAGIQAEEARLVVAGEVVSAEVRKLRSGRRLLQFDLSDGTDSISAKCFLNPDEPDPGAHVRPGAWLRVRGPVQTDRYTQELTLQAEDILAGEPERRRDDAPEKRVELHLHTKMSQLDSVLDVQQAVAQVAAWGHSALAVTDHGVVQAFPELHAAAARHGIKPIFGMEAYVTGEGAPIVWRPQPWLLTDVELIAVDLETTGFSATHDEPIEIGAVRVKNGQVVDEFGAFMRPSRRIPVKVQELTGITDEMVRDAEPPETVLRRFWAWAGGPEAVLLAHNAQFDLAFLQVWRSRLFGDAIANPVIDTLWLGRAVLPHLRSHALAALARELGVTLGQHHRATHDARSAYDIYTGLLGRLRDPEPGAERQPCDTLEELAALETDAAARQVRPFRATLLATSQSGLQNLYKLVSRSHTEFFHRVPRIPRRLLAAHREGLLIGSSGPEGELWEAAHRGADDERLDELLVFYDYVELFPATACQRLVRDGVVPDLLVVEALHRRLYAAGKRLGKPVVAVGDARYLDPEDQVYRRILKSAQDGQRDDGSDALHLRTTAEMVAEFAYLGEEAAHEVAVTAPAALAAAIPALRPVPEGLFTPVLPGAAEQVEAAAWARAREQYGEPLPELVSQRLTRELAAIIGNEFAVLYLTAQKLVERSEQDGYLVGSRGSVGSSLVATMTGITEVNPLPPHYRCERCRHSEFFTDGSHGSGFDLPDKACPSCGAPLGKDGHDIPFETFLGFSGDKVPDIDLNFSGENQAAIHAYTAELFGPDQVFRAGTIGTIAERTAFGYVKGWLEKTGQPEPRRAELNRLALGISGVKRNTGSHPGGMMVVPAGRDITEFSPFQHPADDPKSGIRTTHFDYHAIHDTLCKLDILGHDDPTVLRKLGELTDIDVRRLPFDDPQTQSLFSSLDALGISQEDAGGYDVGTIGVPEFGTGFVRRMLMETRPRSFSDLVRISGLSHGTDVWTNNAQQLIERGVATLQDVIPCRDDIMVYLMYRGMEPALAFRIMESVRRGRGLTAEWEADMRAHGVPDWYIDSCQKIKYMFPKAHAAAYVMMGFRIAWFKVHHPLAFYATYFSVRAGEFDADLICRGQAAVQSQLQELERKGNETTGKEKNLLAILETAREMMARGYTFQKVDVYDSDATDFIIRGDSLLPPLRTLSGLGGTAAQGVVSARAAGEFTSLEDLRQRARLSKTVIDLLQRHGAVPADLPASNQLSLF